MSGIRMTEEQYAAVIARQRSASAPERPVSAERQTVGMPTPPEPAEAPSGPKFKSKAEARYAQLLEAQKRDGLITDWKYEAITLRLADGVRYTPDFMVRIGDRMRLVEVKGHMREAARVRLRVAVEMYPCFTWLLVWARKGKFEPELLR